MRDILEGDTWLPIPFPSAVVSGSIWAHVGLDVAILLRRATGV